jgi:hypothetical protein
MTPPQRTKQEIAASPLCSHYCRKGSKRFGRPGRIKCALESASSTAGEEERGLRDQRSPRRLRLLAMTGALLREQQQPAAIAGCFNNGILYIVRFPRWQPTDRRTLPSSGQDEVLFPGPICQTETGTPAAAGCLCSSCARSPDERKTAFEHAIPAGATDS